MVESHGALPCALYGLAASAVLALIGWLMSLPRRDVSVIDPFWPFMITVPGWVYVLCLPGPGTRGLLAMALASAWALRLGIHLAWRRRGQHGEDRRYQAIRERNEPGFAFKSLYLVFGLQAVLAWIVSAPLGVAAYANAPINALDIFGAALALFGIVFEAVADAQLARFKTGKSQKHQAKDQVMDQGLWHYSRHPNYFGETCVWWGLGVIALAGGGACAAWALLSPLMVTVMLLKVSGVTLLEADLVKRRDGYRDYVERTSAFVPRPPRPKEKGNR